MRLLLPSRCGRLAMRWAARSRASARLRRSKTDPCRPRGLKSQARAIESDCKEQGLKLVTRQSTARRYQYVNMTLVINMPRPPTASSQPRREARRAGRVSAFASIRG